MEDVDTSVALSPEGCDFCDAGRDEIGRECVILVAELGGSRRCHSSLDPALLISSDRFRGHSLPDSALHISSDHFCGHDGVFKSWAAPDGATHC